MFGFQKMLASLEKMQDQVPKELDKMLYAEGLAIFRKSQRIVPVDNGYLKASGVIEKPVNHEVLIGYGGVAASYALFVHEGGEKKWSRPGKRAKFLEEPVMEAQQGMEQRLAKKIEETTEGKSTSTTDAESPTEQGGNE